VYACLALTSSGLEFGLLLKEAIAAAVKEVESAVPLGSPLRSGNIKV
jgi:hypothetical protein